MKKINKGKKKLLYYYGGVLIGLMLFNLFITPFLAESQVKEVDYGKFMTMTEKKQIGMVEIQDNQILFTDKDNSEVYKTGVMPDSNLTDRLYESGATFSKDIVRESSPINMMLFTWVLPMIIFVVIGQILGKRMKKYLSDDCIWSERKTHRYIKCKKCKTMCRVPKGKGKIKIKCSKCGTEVIKKV